MVFTCLFLYMVTAKVFTHLLTGTLRLVRTHRERWQQDRCPLLIHLLSSLFALPASFLLPPPSQPGWTVWPSLWLHWGSSQKPEWWENIDNIMTARRKRHFSVSCFVLFFSYWLTRPQRFPYRRRGLQSWLRHCVVFRRDCLLLWRSSNQSNTAICWTNHGCQIKAFRSAQKMSACLYIPS